MESLTEHFEERMEAFPRRTRLTPSEFGEGAIGDRKLWGVGLTKRMRRFRGPGSIHGASTWRTARLAGARYRPASHATTRT